MPTIYETSDGDKHDSIGSALAHQSILDMRNSSTPSSTSSSRKLSPEESKTRSLYLEAEKLFNQSNYDGAISLANESLSYNKTFFSLEKNCYMIIARSYFNKGDYLSSIDNFSKIIKSISIHHRLDYNFYGYIINHRGLAYKNIGNIEKAIEDFKFAADFNNKDSIENLKNMNINYTPGTPYIFLKETESNIVSCIDNNRINYLQGWIDQWEKLASRQMTDDDKIRIYGKLFTKEGVVSSGGGIFSKIFGKKK